MSKARLVQRAPPDQRIDRAHQLPPDLRESHTDSHARVRHDKIDTDGKLTLRVNGRLHHLGMGRTLARTPVIMLIHDLHLRVVHATTGELLRELTVDPSRDYQPTGKTRYPTRKTEKTKP